MPADPAVRSLQQQLNKYGYDAGPNDGFWGPRTAGALKEFQKANFIPVTGVIDQDTRGVLYGGKIIRNDEGIPDRSKDTAPIKVKTAFPPYRDVQKVFGVPGSPAATAGKCRLPIPFRIAWDMTQTVNRFSCHILVQDTFTEMFKEAVTYYGPARYRELGLDIFGGCYNNRPMRGGSKPSTHAFGIAVDLWPQKNLLRETHVTARFARPEYIPFWEIVERYGLVSLGRERDFDWMHFQACGL